MATWAVILIVAALVLYVLELFIPSGGLLGLIATLSLIGGLICTFMVSMMLGLVMTLVVLALAPVGIAAAFKLFPHTPVGRRLILNSQQSLALKNMNYDPARDDHADSLLGAKGEAVSELRPVGICRINDQRVECLSVSGIIDPGDEIEVVSVNGIEVKVKKR